MICGEFTVTATHINGCLKGCWSVFAFILLVLSDLIVHHVEKKKLTEASYEKNIK